MFATEKEIDEAREKLLEVIGYDHDYEIEFSLSRYVNDKGAISYTKKWHAGCILPVKKSCKCCGKHSIEYFTTITDYKNDTPMKAVLALIKNIEAGDYV